MIYNRKIMESNNRRFGTNAGENQEYYREKMPRLPCHYPLHP